MEFEEFRQMIQRRHDKKDFKVKGSWGVYDVYKHIRKNKWYNIGRPLKEGEFYAIIRGVNKLLAEEITNGRDIVFPHKMGRLELKRIERGVRIVNGKLENTYPIDWNETIKLWFEDADAREKKILIRRDNPYVYCVKYSKSKADYNNKVFYAFVLNLFIKKALKEKILNGKIDALW